MPERENIAPHQSKSPKFSKYAIILFFATFFGAEARKLGLPEAQSSTVTPTHSFDIDAESLDHQRRKSLQKAKQSMTVISEKIGIMMAGKIAWNFGTEQNRNPQNAANFIQTLPAEDQKEICNILRHIAEHPDDQEEVTEHCISLLNASTVGATLSPIFIPILKGGDCAQQKAKETLGKLKLNETLMVTSERSDQ
jgi:hypothetical protein